MINKLFGTKGKMTQTFVDGVRLPVTEVTLGPCTVTQIKNMDKDGYWSVQLGFGNKKEKNTTKSLQGHLNKSNKLQVTSDKSEETNKKEQNFPRYIKEVRLDSEPEFKVGDVIAVEAIFKAGDVLMVSGTMKGKGFAGGVRRYNFRGGPKTHGQSDRHRAPGSVGQTTTPGRVYKGKRMAGRMGGNRVSIKNLKIVEIKEGTNKALISGAIPGRVGSFLEVTKIN